jgi:ketosteroid isomerase-like protein
MDRAGAQAWIDAYERAWRTAGIAGLSELFTDDVRYSPSPWADAIVGLSAVARFWDDERDGPDEGFTMTSEIVAVDGDIAIARVAVDYLRDPAERWRDLWVMRFAADGRCAEFEEWPFAPDRPDGH